jgi:hypothetical protein
VRARRAALAGAIAVAACGRDAGGPTIPAAAIAYVDGATAAVVTPGHTIVLEGYGFGTVRGTGTVTFASAGGGVTVALVPDSASWSEFAIEVVVPPDAVTGDVTVITDVGERLTTTVYVLPSVPFDPAGLAWQPRAGFPRAPVGVALAAAEYATSGGVTTTLYAAGGAEPLGGDSAFVPETGVHVARATAGGEITAWARQPESATSANRSLPAPRAFAAAAVATPHNSRLSAGAVLYVIGGIDGDERVQRSVFGTNLSADSVVSAFVSLEPLPVPIAGAVAIVRRGSVYVLGGADSAGQPVNTVYVARVTPNGVLDGWYVQPATPGPRAYGGGALIDRRAAVFGGFAEPVHPGGGLDPTPARLASGDTGLVSRRSGFFTGSWGGTDPVLPEPRSQFATLAVGNALLVVGGMYAGAATDAAETLAATTAGDSLGGFTGPVGTATIAGQGGGTLVGPAGATWRDASGAYHGLVLGGMDLATRLRRTGVWGF